jgi:hypothetical protein
MGSERQLPTLALPLICLPASSPVERGEGASRNADTSLCTSANGEIDGDGVFLPVTIREKCPAGQ